MDYFTKNVEVFRNGMVNGPLPGINKVDALIIGLTLEIAIREDIIIE